MQVIAIVTLLLCVSAAFAAQCPNPTTPGQNQPFAQKPTLYVGFAYSSSIGDLGFTATYENARLAVKNEFAGRIVTEYRVIPVPPNQTCDDICYPALIKFIQDGSSDGHPWDVIITSGSSFTNRILVVAPMFPAVKFLQGSQYRPAAFPSTDNLAVFYAWYEQARFLTGYTSALLTKTGQICYTTVNAQQQVIKQIDAFAVGVDRADPSVKINWIKSNAFGCAECDRNASLYLLEPVRNPGCDVLAYQSLYAVGASVACNLGLLSTGYGSDIGYYLGDSVVDSAVFDYAPYFRYKFNQLLSGIWADEEIFIGTITDGTISLGTISPRLPENIRISVLGFYNALANDCYNPFCGPLLNAWNVNPTNNNGCLSYLQTQNINAPLTNIKDYGNVPAGYVPSAAISQRKPACELCADPATPTNPTSAPTQAPTQAPDPCQGSVSLTKTGEWGTGSDLTYQYKITLTNTGSGNINGARVSLPVASGSITSYWNMQPVSGQANQYSLNVYNPFPPGSNSPTDYGFQSKGTNPTVTASLIKVQCSI